MAALEFINFDGSTGKENSIFNFQESQLVIFVVNTWQLWFLDLFDWMCLKCCKLNHKACSRSKYYFMMVMTKG